MQIYTHACSGIRNHNPSYQPIRDSTVFVLRCFYNQRTLRNFSEATDGTMCPGVESASKNEYLGTPGGEGGRCVRVTTLPPSQCRKLRKSGALNFIGQVRPIARKLYHFIINAGRRDSVLLRAGRSGVQTSMGSIFSEPFDMDL
jgi:hypothetical protein